MSEGMELVVQDSACISEEDMEPLAPSDPHNSNKPAAFDFITENVISPLLQNSKDRKRAKRMVCECQFDPDGDPPEDACGGNCLNKLLMIECGSRCPCGEYCRNKNFQRANYAEVEVFKTEKKGWGLRALNPISSGSFVMEYCGEVCTLADFEQRKIEYSKEKRRHYYFMSLKADQILDATRKGNLSRYINHSCDPNCETQKWTVNGRLCIGFFSVRGIEPMEELTFDYQFQRFGDVAQKCYCGAANCRGFLGQTKQAPSSVKVLSQPADQALSSPVGSPSTAKKRAKQPRHQNPADSAFEKEIFELVGPSWRLRNADSDKSSDKVLAFSQAMLRAETFTQKTMLLQVLLGTTDTACLKKFLFFQGLKLLRLWMIDSAEPEGLEAVQFQILVLQTLSHLPVSSKNQLNDINFFPVVSRWANGLPALMAKVRSPPPGKFVGIENSALGEDPSSPQNGTIETAPGLQTTPPMSPTSEAMSPPPEGIVNVTAALQATPPMSPSLEGIAKEATPLQAMPPMSPSQEGISKEAAPLQATPLMSQSSEGITKEAAPLQATPPMSPNLEGIMNETAPQLATPPMSDGCATLLEATPPVSPTCEGGVSEQDIEDTNLLQSVGEKNGVSVGGSNEESMEVETVSNERSSGESRLVKKEHIEGEEGCEMDTDGVGVVEGMASGGVASEHGVTAAIWTAEAVCSDEEECSEADRGVCGEDGSLYSEWEEALELGSVEHTSLPPSECKIQQELGVVAMVKQQESGVVAMVEGDHKVNSQVGHIPVSETSARQASPCSDAGSKHTPYEETGGVSKDGCTEEVAPESADHAAGAAMGAVDSGSGSQSRAMSSHISPDAESTVLCESVPAGLCRRGIEWAEPRVDGHERHFAVLVEGGDAITGTSGSHTSPAEASTESASEQDSTGEVCAAPNKGMVMGSGQSGEREQCHTMVAESRQEVMVEPESGQSTVVGPSQSEPGHNSAMEVKPAGVSSFAKSSHAVCLGVKPSPALSAMDAMGISESLMEAVGINQSMMDAISVSLRAVGMATAGSSSSEVTKTAGPAGGRVSSIQSEDVSQSDCVSCDPGQASGTVLSGRVSSYTFLTGENDSSLNGRTCGSTDCPRTEAARADTSIPICSHGNPASPSSSGPSSPSQIEPTPNTAPKHDLTSVASLLSSTHSPSSPESPLGTACGPPQVCAKTSHLPTTTTTEFSDPSLDDVMSPSAASSGDVKSPSAASTEDVKSPSAANDEDVKSPSAASNEDVKSPQAANTEDVKSPQAANTEDVKSPQAANTGDVKSPQAARRGDIKSPSIASDEDIKSPSAASNEDVKSPSAASTGDVKSLSAANNEDVKSPISLQDQKKVEDLKCQVQAMAQGLLEKWSKLKEVFRIPKRARKRETVQEAREEPQEEDPVPVPKRDRSGKGRGFGRKEVDSLQQHRGYKGSSHLHSQQVTPSPWTHGHLSQGSSSFQPHHGSTYQATPSHGPYQATPTHGHHHGSSFQTTPSHGQGSSPYQATPSRSHPVQSTPPYHQVTGQPSQNSSPYQTVQGSTPFQGGNSVAMQQPGVYGKQQTRLQNIPPLLPPSSHQPTQQGVQQTTPPSHSFTLSPLHNHHQSAGLTTPLNTTSPQHPVLTVASNTAPSGVFPLPQSGLVSNQMAAPFSQSPSALMTAQIPLTQVPGQSQGLTPTAQLSVPQVPRQNPGIAQHLAPLIPGQSPGVTPVSGVGIQSLVQNVATSQQPVQLLSAQVLGQNSGIAQPTAQLATQSLLSTQIPGLSLMNASSGLVPAQSVVGAAQSATTSESSYSAFYAASNANSVASQLSSGLSAASATPPTTARLNPVTGQIMGGGQQSTTPHNYSQQPSPVVVQSQEPTPLPANWLSARDPSGKVYYYHSITRKTQWEFPSAKEDSTVTMDLGTPEQSSEDEEPPSQSKGPHTPTEDEADIDERQPHTPEDSPPTEWRSRRSTSRAFTRSPSSPGTLEIHETSPKKSRQRSKRQRRSRSSSQPFASNRSNSASLHSPSGSPRADSTHSGNHRKRKSSTPPTKRRKKESKTREQQRIEEFRHKLSRTVTACLDQHRKSDCKYGRITCAEDFKYLARKLTYGLTEKETGRKGKLEFTSSVKAKVKEYIRGYMKKLGPVYRRITSSPQDMA